MKDVQTATDTEEIIEVVSTVNKTTVKATPESSETTVEVIEMAAPKTEITTVDAVIAQDVEVITSTVSSNATVHSVEIESSV